jgi:ribonuclease D
MKYFVIIVQMNQDHSTIISKKDEAIRRWGKSLKRPHSIYTGLLEKRRELNLSLPILVNPFGNEILSWCFTKNHLNVAEVSGSHKVEWVQSLGQLSKLKDRIEKEKECTILYKDCTESTFLGMIVILQFFVNNRTYVVDCYRLHLCIRSILGGIFVNPDVLKVTYDASIVTKLQRDFDVYLVGLILCEEVYNFQLGKTEPIPLELMLSELCQFSRDERVNFAEWGSRPLHSALLEELKLECVNLTKCWNILKSKLGDSLLMFEYKESIAACCQIYFQPSVEDSNILFRSSFPENMSGIFDVPQQESLYGKLLSWRMTQCRDYDFNLDQFVSSKRLGTICRAMPVSRDSLIHILPEANSWKLSARGNHQTAHPTGN